MKVHALREALAQFPPGAELLLVWPDTGEPEQEFTEICNIACGETELTLCMLEPPQGKGNIEYASELEVRLASASIPMPGSANATKSQDASVELEEWLCTK